jgi:hypothetical protein
MFISSIKIVDTTGAILQHPMTQNTSEVKNNRYGAAHRNKFMQKIRRLIGELFYVRHRTDKTAV